MIVYQVVGVPFWLYELFTNQSMLLGEKVGPPICMVAVFIYFAAMIINANRLPNDFGRCYKRARWLSILAGAFGFPLLTVPAFIGVWRLSKYRN